MAKKKKQEHLNPGACAAKLKELYISEISHNNGLGKYGKEYLTNCVEIKASPVTITKGKETATVTLTFTGREHPSVQPKKYGYVDVIPLLNDGFSLKGAPPEGEWHGMTITAASNHTAAGFVQGTVEALSQYMTEFHIQRIEAEF